MKVSFFSLVILIAVSCKNRADYLHEGKAVSTAIPVFDVGNTSVDSFVKNWDTDVRPDGVGLPPGEANPLAGQPIFEQKCASCHGLTGREGPMVVLVSTDTGSAAVKAIGNYWPYATTLFDYIKRTMPYQSPGSLTNEEVYALTAWLLYQNKLIPDTFNLNRITLPEIEMPARKNFIEDDRRGGPVIR
jgi:cytochrome c